MSEEEEKPDSRLPTLRTLQSDTALWASREQASRISILSRELESRSRALWGRKRQGPWTLAILFAVLILLGAGAFGSWYYYSQKGAEIPPPPRPRSLIAVDEEIEIELTQANRDISLRKAHEVLSVPFKKGPFRRVVFSEPKNGGRSFIDTEEFLKIAKLEPPRGLKANLNEFTLGSLAQGTSSSPFLLFRVLSYPDSFAGMLEWEKTIANDVRLLFEGIPPLKGENFFRDVIVKNQDTRALEYQGGTVLAYAFFNKNILILSSSRQTLEQIISRYEIFPPR